MDDDEQDDTKKPNLTSQQRNQVISSFMDQRFLHGEEWLLERGAITNVAKNFLTDK